MALLSKKIAVLEKVDSTNNYAMALIKKGAAVSENAVLAMEQTQGKGRRGKRWTSSNGENLLLSIMLEMQWLPLFRQFEFSVAVALGCHDFISKRQPLETFIKWPNDIFINDRKAGGVLIESVVKGAIWQWAVVGIGINVNQVKFDDNIYPPTSLKQITGIHYNVLIMAEELHTLVLNRIAEMKEKDFSLLLTEYNEKLFGRNRVMKLKKDNSVFETEIIGVSQSGQLITRDALERRFNFDEVEWKL